MNNTLLASFCALSSIFTFSATAVETIKWDNISLAYESADLDSEFVNLDFDGFELTGSTLINEHVFIRGSYSLLTNDDFGADIDLKQLTLGVGYRYPINAKTDIYAALALEDIEFEAADSSEDDTGYSISLGARTLLNKQVQLNAELTHIDAFDETDTIIKISGQYHFTEQFAASIGYENQDDYDALIIDGTYFF